MRFICDVHIPIRLSKYLANHAVESVHVNPVLRGSSTSDELISQHADQHEAIVITKDINFRNTYFLKKTPRKLIRICLGNISNDRLIENQLTLLDQLDLEGSLYMEINPDTTFIY